MGKPRSMILSSKKRELLEALLREKGVDTVTLEKIPRRDDRDSAPLSFAQQRLWFLDQLEPNSSFYHVPCAFFLRGTLHVEALQQALGDMIRRHDILRSTYTVVQEQTMQRVTSELELPVSIVDLCEIPPAERMHESMRLAQEEADHPFSLNDGPLLRLKLFRLGPEETILLLTMHHIVTDGWSEGVFLQELSQLYEAHVSGRPPQLTELPIQYGDFAAWQQQWLQGKILDEQLAYWKEQLAGDLPVLQLPTDRPRGSVQTHSGATYSFRLSKHVAEQLSALSRREESTLFMTLMAAFQLLLFRYTGQEDILVGTPIANRNRAEIEPLIGLFVNTLVLRTDLSGSPAFQELLRRVRKITLDAFAHQDLPFERLVSELQPDRKLNQSPLFQVLFALQNNQKADLQLSGLEVRPLELETNTSKFDLSLFVEEEADGLHGTFEYNTDLMDPSTVERMAEHFCVLLAGIVEQPSCAIDRMPLLTAQENAHSNKRNRTTTEYPRDQSVEYLFEQQVAKTPNAIALRFLDKQFTYRELNESANRLAYRLKQRGVQCGSLVGICVERSPELIIGLLGILKAGCAYVPFDPAYPHERLTNMLEDTQVSALITQQALLDQLPVYEGQTLCLDDEFAEEAVAIGDELQADYVHSPERLAYINYTSGSTSKPKGVCVPHRGIVRLVKGTEFIRFSQEDVYLQFAPVSFDAATLEIWGSLLNGAQLIIAPPHALSIEELGACIRDNRVTTLWLTSGLFHQFVDEQLEYLVHVKQLLVGGDVVSPIHARTVLEKLPNVHLYNAYGPTENTTFTTVYPITSLDRIGTTVPIGRPIANTEVYVLDKRLQPVPDGVPAELYIGGDGLALGYLNRDDLTSLAFVPNPFDEQSESILYKTGDLVRWLSDGNLEFLGRIDNQVKIRGFRIELGEIESVLSLHQEVKECLVIAREMQPGDKRLIAYLITDDPQFAMTELRQFVRSKLPEHMVPSHFIRIDHFPLTPNGKVDKRALPNPNEISSGSGQEHIPPRTEVERQVASIWKEVLGIHQVGVHDHFFECGGHSLLATRVISRIRNLLQVELPLREMFEAQTIELLAKRIEQMRETKSLISDQPIGKAGRRQPRPLSSPQQRLWFLDRLEPGSSAYHIPLVLRLRGALDRNALVRSVKQIVHRHEVLRTTYVEVDGHPIQVIGEDISLAVQLEDLSGLTEAQALEWIELEAKRSFDLQRDMPIRAYLLELAKDWHLLFLNIHHIAADGWSIGLLADELAHLYQTNQHDLPQSLEALPIQYADYALWQQQQFVDPAMNEHLIYWKEQLAGGLPVLQLPTDLPRPAKQTFRGDCYTFLLPLELADALRKMGHDEGATLFMTLLAGFKILLYRYTGQASIQVGTPVANRNRQEIEGLIGLFVNSLILRTTLSGELTFRELLARVRETSLGGYAHQEMPFEKLVEVLQPERDMSYSPLFQVMFALQNNATKHWELPGVTSEMLPIGSPTAKLDLSLVVTETGEGLRIELEYNTDLFYKTTIVRMAEHLQNLLQAVVVRPDQMIAHLPMLAPEEEQQLIANGGGAQEQVPKHQCPQQWIEQYAEHEPDSVAVACVNETLTYRELNERANQIASYLRHRGASPGSRIGICMHRSASMIVGLLGIIKTGAAYVPIDPAYPPARIEFMLDDASVALLLTEESVLDQLPAHQVERVCLDKDWEQIAPEPAENPPCCTTLDDVAYVIYTSGSTGLPKGVLITHESLLNLIFWHIREYEVAPQDRASHLAGVAFDASVWEIWPYLVSGASVHVPDEETRLSPARLRDWLLEQKITLCFLPTPLAESMLLLEWPQQTALRKLLTGGDQLRSYAPAALPFDLVNHYGPTESTVVATSFTVPTQGRAQSTPSIGRPIANTRVYILDTDQQVVPVNVPGELYIEGAGLALGYLNRPELTKEKFILSPFEPHTGSRLYKTGDLGRWLPDGTIEFLGRVDNQVKIRGLRIELGEIESLLIEHSSVQDAAVIVREDMRGDKQIIAYVGLHPQSDLEIGQLKQRLQEKLPVYMVPSHLIALDALPLTPNGKLDRSSLPAPSGMNGDKAQRKVLPRDVLEHTVGQVFESLLGIHPIGVHDNFFSLGGHSLLAVRMIEELKRRFGQEIPLSLLFKVGTIEQLANALRQKQEAKRSPLIALRTEGDNPPFFCVHPVGGSVFAYFELARTLGEDQPFYALQSLGLEEGQQPHRSVEEMAAAYLEEVRAVQPSGPYYLGGWSFGGVVAFEMAQQLRKQSQEIAFVTLFDSYVPSSVFEGQAKDKESVVREFAVDFAGTLGFPLPSSLREGSITDANEALVELMRAAIKQGALPEDYDFSDFSRRSEVFQANRNAYSNYTPEPYPHRVTFMKAQEPEDMRPDAGGWEQFARELHVHRITADHFNMLQPPNVQEVVQKWKSDLNR